MTRTPANLPQDLADHIANLWASIDETKATLDVYERQLAAAVKHARRLNCSWRAIGAAIGTSAQAAYQRYDHLGDQLAFDTAMRVFRPE
jgi:hypothetical protein